MMFESLWPRGGWGRAAQYVRHRLRRLPDSPERIARGIMAGVFTTFTPFYGLHFLVAGLLAWMMRGNVLAALLGTFFGNPLTYVPIGVIALQTGHFLLGTRPPASHAHMALGDKFVAAGRDLWDNLIALFTGVPPHWDGLLLFYDEVFFPYLIGGLIPGVLAAVASYYISLPLIGAYQKRRRAKIERKAALLAERLIETQARASAEQDRLRAELAKVKAKAATTATPTKNSTNPA
jgi:uncharacterized protein (DUF2062 family)